MDGPCSSSRRSASEPTVSSAASSKLRDLDRDAAELEIAKRDHTWFGAALRDFA